MRKLLILCGFGLLLAFGAQAQDTPGLEVAGSYQYFRVNPGGGAPGSNCEGGAGSVAGYVNRWAGIVGEFSGCRVTGLPSGSSLHQFSYLFGPRIAFSSRGRVTPFVQGLFGGERATASVSGLGSDSENAFAFAFGGGADVSLTQHVSVRAIQFDYFGTHYAGATQNNFRLQTGLVWHFGR